MCVTANCVSADWHAGIWEVEVSLSDAQVEGSPFQVNVYDPSKAFIISKSKLSKIHEVFYFEGIAVSL